LNWLNSKVVVTGGAGFLGSHLCQALVERGAKVTVVDDFSFSAAGNLAAISDDIQLVHHQLGGPSDSLELTEGWDVLFHLAAVADPRKCKEDFDLAFQTNVVGTKNILASCNNNGRVIFLSTASVYGEPEYVPIDEQHPLKGNDPYAITKIMGEGLCKHYYENAGVPVTIVRNFNTFGPRQSRAYLIPTLIYQALTSEVVELWNPDPVRDFAYVSNTVDALLAIADTEKTLGLTINVGGGEGIRAGDLAEKIGAMFQVPVVDLKKQVGGSAKLICDNSKLKTITGWSPTVTLEEGLSETIAYWRKQAEKEWCPG
jgi:nucleoside-diphosphate-sugar epimerase